MFKAIIEAACIFLEVPQLDEIREQNWVEQRSGVQDLHQGIFRAGVVDLSTYVMKNQLQDRKNP
jgi:hypothetical protein